MTESRIPIREEKTTARSLGPGVVIARIAWIAIPLLACGCDWLNGPQERNGVLQIAMNPDSTAFAYALDFKTTPTMYVDFGRTAHVEIWTYDLVNRKGPTRIASWPHDWDWSLRIAGWTAKGIYIESFGPQGSDPRRRYQKLDPRTGRHSPTDDPSDYLRTERPGGPAEYRDEYRRTRHVEEHWGMFSLWDPAKYRLIPLFELPVDPRPGMSSRDAVGYREMQVRQEGIQDIASVTAAPSADGLALDVRTFAKRPANYVRSYRMHVDFQVPEPGEHDYETNTIHESFFDTTVTPNPAGELVHLIFPYSRFIEALRPERKIMRGYGATYHGNVAIELIPDAMEGDEHIPPGIRDGRTTSTWTMVTIPLR